ncbi:MAG: restriction endonuclease subunit S [Pseudomonadota bacterium]
MNDQTIQMGWTSCQLGTVLTLINGRAYKKPEMLDTGTPILRIQNLNGGENWFYSDINLPPEKYCEKGDLLYAWSATFGPYWSRWDHKLIFHYHIWKILPSYAIDKRFAYYELLRVTEDLKASAHGVAMPHITKSGMESWNITLPSLAEQKVIAEKLDTLLAQVENTKARLERIPQLLKSFRQSVLAAAVSGRLTEEWRSTSELTGWANISLRDLVQNIEAGKNLKCIETPPGENEFGIIKISAVTWGTYDEEQSKTLPEKKLFLESRRINVGDFLISRANTIDLLGNPVIVQKVTKNLMLSDKVLRLNMDDEDKAWVNIFLRSMTGRKEIQDRSTGNQMSMRNIGQKALLEIPIPKPLYEEQTEIVCKVDQLFAHADRIEQQVNRALDRVNNLTQSILAKAFRGELTEQWRKDNPDLISGENSAEALLERIKAEKAASKPAKKTRKQTTA